MMAWTMSTKSTINEAQIWYASISHCLQSKQAAFSNLIPYIYTYFKQKQFMWAKNRYRKLLMFKTEIIFYMENNNQLIFLISGLSHFILLHCLYFNSSGEHNIIPYTLWGRSYLKTWTTKRRQRLQSSGVRHCANL